MHDFVERVFFTTAYDGEATVVGFNLPYDLSRLALDSRRALPVYHRNRKGEIIRFDRSMVGGFTMPLSEKESRPNLRVKHLTRRMAWINFAYPSDNPTQYRRRKRDDTKPRTRGFFLDLKTLAAALTSKSHSLDSLAEFLEVPGKIPFDDCGFRRSRPRIPIGSRPLIPI